MSPERREVAAWWDRAEHDRSAAMRLNTPGCLELEIIAFHCQQAVEKYLKAFLVAHGRPFQKTHDIGLLLGYCEPVDPAFGSIRDVAEPLTVFAVTFRYPGPGYPSRADVDFSLAAVEAVRAFVEARIHDLM